MGRDKYCSSLNVRMFLDPVLNAVGRRHVKDVTLYSLIPKPPSQLEDTMVSPMELRHKVFSKGLRKGFWKRLERIGGKQKAYNMEKGDSGAHIRRV